jgi:hypothetical protein
MQQLNPENRRLIAFFRRPVDFVQIINFITLGSEHGFEFDEFAATELSRAVSELE